MAHVSVCRTRCTPLWSEIANISPYHPPQRDSGGSPDKPQLVIHRISPSIAVAGQLRCSERDFFTPRYMCIPFLFPSDFLCPYSFFDGQYTQRYVLVRRYPLSILFWSEPNSASATNSTYSIFVLLQDFRKTCTQLWILSTNSAPKIGLFVNALSYCRSNQSI